MSVADELLPAAPPAPARAAEPGVVTPLLYRAVLGAGRSTERYLAVFERLDATGRALAGWNWSAALCPPGWMAFRQLWGVLPAYLAALLLLGALVFFLGHTWLALPPPMLGGLALAALLLACGVPGLYGDVLLHQQVQRRMRAAVAQATSLRGAIEALQAQAPHPRQLLQVAGAGGALLLAGVVAWGWWQASLPAPGAAPAAEPVAAVQPVGQEMVAPAPLVLIEPPQAALPEPAAGAAAGASVASVAEADPVAVASSAPIASAPPNPTPASTIEAASSSSSSSSSFAEAPVSKAATPKAAGSKAAGPKAAAAKVSGAQAAVPAVPAPNEAEPPVPAPEAAARSLYVNVGLFADPANARRAHQRLRQAGLPSAVSEVRQADGRWLQRVRVGPFTSAAQANAAAAQVRALGLDAAAAAHIP